MLFFFPPFLFFYLLFFFPFSIFSFSSTVHFSFFRCTPCSLPPPFSIVPPFPPYSFCSLFAPLYLHVAPNLPSSRSSSIPLPPPFFCFSIFHISCIYSSLYPHFPLISLLSFLSFPLSFHPSSSYYSIFPSIFLPFLPFLHLLSVLTSLIPSFIFLLRFLLILPLSFSNSSPFSFFFSP